MTNPKPAVITTPISSPPNNAPSIGPMLVLDDLTIITGNTYKQFDSWTFYVIFN